MQRYIIVVLALAMLALTSGCETLFGPNAESARRDEDMRILAERVRELQEQVNGLKLANENLARESETVRGASQGASQSVQARIEALERQVQSINKAREQDRAAIVEEISRKVAGLVAQSPARSAPAGNSSEYGYEYVVKQGDTLGEIAKAYKVSVNSILKANKMKSAQSLRVGQKLFIPEK